ncbi:MAG: hypothetical protein ACLFU6_00420 [Candidatus Hydrogenedentota bacterium]
MTKSIIVAIVTLSLGAIAGTIVTQTRLSGEMEQLRGEHRESLRLANETQEALASTERRAERLAQQNTHLEDRLDRLHATLEDAQGGAGAVDAQDEGESLDGEALAGVEDARMEMPQGANAPQREAAMDWREELAREREEDAEATEEEREARREERRQEWEQRAQQMRDDMRERLQEAIQTAEDPQSRDRMTAVAEYSEYIMELREQMRDAGDDEQREALVEEMREAGREVRNLVEEQQEHNLMNVAEQYGITDEAEARALIESLDEARSDGILGGGRRGGMPGVMGRGGPGGGRGR